MKKANRVIYSILILVMGLSVTACGKKATVPEESETVVETTVDPEEKFKINKEIVLEPQTKEVVETLEGGGEIGVKSNGETVYDMGRYGEPGEAVFNHIASAWVKRNISDEPELRGVMSATFGELSTKEELTKEILAMERESQAVSETKALANNSDNKSDSQSGKTNTQNNTSSTQPTQGQTVTSGGQSVESSFSPDWTPEDEAEWKKTKEEWVANQPEVTNRGGGDKMDWDPDEAPGQWNWK